MATEDGPEASLADALRRERNAKLEAFVQRHGLAVATLAHAAVHLYACSRAAAMRLARTLAAHPVERTFLTDLLLSTLATIAFAGALRTSTTALLAAGSPPDVGPVTSQQLVTAVSAAPWIPFLLLVVYQTLQFLQTLCREW